MKTEHFSIALMNAFTILALAAALVAGSARAAPPAQADVGAMPQAPASGSRAAAAAISDIKVQFKLDPRITKSLYMGERWVSPPAYSQVGENKKVIVEARGHGQDARGQPSAVSLTWTAANPDMVAVSPARGHQVAITVLHAGESSVEVNAQGVSRTLAIKAEYKGDFLHVEITPKMQANTNG